MKPDRNKEWPEGYSTFINDLTNAFLSELYPSEEELGNALKDLYQKHNGPATPPRLNVYYGARLIYVEKWVMDVLSQHLKDFDLTLEDEKILKEALMLCQKERIDFRNIEENGTLTVNYDFLSWRDDSYKASPKRIDPKRMIFTIKPDVKQQILSYIEECSDQDDKDFFYNVSDMLIPRTNQLYSLNYQSIKTCEMDRKK